MLEGEIEKVKKWVWPRYSGKVTHVIGMLIESIGPMAYLGEICYVFGKNGEKIPCEVVGFKEEKVLLMALSEMSYIAPGSEVFPTNEVHNVPLSLSLCGRILDAFGQPIDGKGPLDVEKYYPIFTKPPSPLSRKRISDKLVTGIKAIDAFITLGKGQRIGIFSEAGVGKSTLLGMLTRHSKADVNVIALIGERGREVKEFIEKELGKEGLAKSVVIVSTADQMATLRSKGALLATTVAEYFRDLGKDVMLMMDSITRYGMALREIGLARGEPPTIRGYPPSLFAYLPKLLERAGQGSKGSITGVYTILQEGDESDPIADHMRSLLDGHIVLSKKMALASHYPPIDILSSLSRVMGDVATSLHLEKTASLREMLQAYKEAEELIEVGIYVEGSNPKVDLAKEKKKKIAHFLAQKPDESSPFEKTFEGLCDL